MYSTLALKGLIKGLLFIDFLFFNVKTLSKILDSERSENLCVEPRG